MLREKVYLRLFGRKLISFTRGRYGEIEGSGLLNPILDRLKLFTMLILQASFYSKYKDLGYYHGKRVANSFAPPVGSRPQFRALLNLILIHLFRIRRPSAMTFAVTYRCQCNCIHCSAADHIKPELEELSTDEAKRLIDECLKMGVSVIAFTGGEPLLRKDIYELVAHVDHRKAMPIMFTSGQFLNEENATKLANAGLYSLFVSLDSTNPAEHDEWRGMPGLFDQAMNGLKLMKENGVMINLSSYASKTGTEKGHYRKVHQLAKEIGAHNVILFDSVPTGAMLKDTSEVLTWEQREEITKYSEEIFNAGTVPALSSQSWQNSIEGSLAGIGCLAANIQFYASAYGDIAPCDFTPLSFGNIRENSLKSIWKRMIKHPAYKKKVSHCRMQHPEFRKRYIDPIPEGATLPYSIDNIENSGGTADTVEDTAADPVVGQKVASAEE